MSIRNFDPEEASDLLATVRSQLTPGDGLLIGVDLCRDEAVLVPAYDDALGVSRAFNLNVLDRLNRELGADFRTERFGHRARWNDGESRMEMHLVSHADQVVRIRHPAWRPGFDSPFATARPFTPRAATSSRSRA